MGISAFILQPEWNDINNCTVAVITILLHLIGLCILCRHISQNFPTLLKWKQFLSPTETFKHNVHGQEEKEVASATI